MVASSLGETYSRNYDDIPTIFDSLYLLYFVKVRGDKLLRWTFNGGNADDQTRPLAYILERREGLKECAFQRHRWPQERGRSAFEGRENGQVQVMRSGL